MLALHESSVVGMATGWAIGRGDPALVVLHTTAGLGNAVGAMATARVNRAPLVVARRSAGPAPSRIGAVSGGHLRGLAGDYPIWNGEPGARRTCPARSPARATRRTTGSGPALVIVPMDDWAAPCGRRRTSAPHRDASCAPQRPTARPSRSLQSCRRGEHPALVVGAGADDPATWQALVALAERLACPVWQESFSARAGFPQDHPHFAGHLPADRDPPARDTRAARRRARRRRAGFQAVPLQRGAVREPGHARRGGQQRPRRGAPEHCRPRAAGGRRAPSAASSRASCLRATSGRAPRAPRLLRRRLPGAGEPMRVGHVFAAIAERIPRNAIVVEESPSSRSELLARLPAREPLGFLSPAMGGLGFALPAATGLRMARPDRPVVAIVGDGSSLYSIQSLWSAAHYGAGALFIVLANGGYAIMDRLAEQAGGSAPWPGFAVDIAGIARALGCPARTIGDHAALLEALDEVLPSLAGRSEPLLLEIEVAP